MTHEERAMQIVQQLGLPKENAPLLLWHFTAVAEDSAASAMTNLAPSTPQDAYNKLQEERDELLDVILKLKNEITALTAPKVEAKPAPPQYKDLLEQKAKSPLANAAVPKIMPPVKRTTKKK